LRNSIVGKWLAKKWKWDKWRENIEFTEKWKEAGAKWKWVHLSKIVKWKNVKKAEENLWLDKLEETKTEGTNKNNFFTEVKDALHKSLDWKQVYLWALKKLELKAGKTAEKASSFVTENLSSVQ